MKRFLLIILLIVLVVLFVGCEGGGMAQAFGVHPGAVATLLSAPITSASTA